MIFLPVQHEYNVLGGFTGGWGGVPEVKSSHPEKIHIMGDGEEGSKKDYTRDRNIFCQFNWLF